VDGGVLGDGVGLKLGAGVLVGSGRRGSPRVRVGRGCGWILGGITVRSTVGAWPSCPVPDGAGVTADAGGAWSIWASV
jgi:hypothetical protein